jgi:alpha-L-arabinofuranosidase
LKNAGKYLTYMSIHKYWDPLWLTNEPSSFLECMMASADPDRFIEHAESVIDAAGFKGRIGIAFDEWNLKGWHHPSKNGVHGADVGARSGNDINSLYTMADALFSACFLNACLRHTKSVAMACMAPLVNARGPIFTHPKGLVKRTTYHALWIYANLLEKNIVGVYTESPMLKFAGKSKMSIDHEAPSIDAVATCDDAMKRWRIAVVNRHPSEFVPCSISLKALHLEGSVRATVLDGASPDDYNDIDSPERVIPHEERLCVVDGEIQIPPHSLCVIEATV